MYWLSFGAVLVLQKSPFALHAAAWRTNTNELLEQLASGADVARRDKVRTLLKGFWLNHG
jgi:hypothetical protein